MAQNERKENGEENSPKAFEKPKMPRTCTQTDLSVRNNFINSNARLCIQFVTPIFFTRQTKEKKKHDDVQILFHRTYIGLGLKITRFKTVFIVRCTRRQLMERAAVQKRYILVQRRDV